MRVAQCVNANTNQAAEEGDGEQRAVVHADYHSQDHAHQSTDDADWVGVVGVVCCHARALSFFANIVGLESGLRNERRWCPGWRWSHLGLSIWRGRMARLLRVDALSLHTSATLPSEVSDDVLHAGDGREGRGTVAFLGEALGAAGVDEVSELFREPGLDRRVVRNDSESVGCLDVLG